MKWCLILLGAWGGSNGILRAGIWAPTPITALVIMERPTTESQ